MASRIGRMILENPLLKAIHIPIGIPIIKQMMTATTIIAIVVIISSHNPKLPIRNIKIANSTPEKIDLKYHPSKKITIIKLHQGMATSILSIKLIVLEEIK